MILLKTRKTLKLRKSLEEARFSILQDEYDALYERAEQCLEEWMESELISLWDQLRRSQKKINEIKKLLGDKRTANVNLVITPDESYYQVLMKGDLL